MRRFGMLRRDVLVRGVALTALWVASCRCTLALDPSLDVNQYSHKAWTRREGFSKGGIDSIAQTPDGYLWLGTEFGLLRFDGVRPVAWQPPGDQRLPSNQILSLLVSRDGALWIGTANGLASWKDGRLTQYQELSGTFLLAIIEDRDGTVWASGVAITTGRVCGIRNSTVQCYGGDGILGRGAFNLYQDSKGNLWAGVKDGLWRWRPGSPKFYPLPGEPDGIQALGEDADGTLLVGWKGGIHRFTDGKTEVYSPSALLPQFRARRILRDHDGGVWIGTQSQGLIHVHEGRADTFAGFDGLSDEDVYILFEDREGSIWAGTISGVDRFRDFTVTTLTRSQGLSSATVTSVLADRDGSIWLGTRRGLNRWNSGQIGSYSLARGQSRAQLGEVPGSLFQDDRGRIWVSTLSHFGYLEKGRFISPSPVPGGSVLSVAEDRAGNLWIANERLGLCHLSPQDEVRQIPWARLGHADHASVLAADPFHGGLWIGFFRGGIAYLEDGRIRASYTASTGLGEGRIGSLQFDHDGALWIATEGGLSRLKDGHVATLTTKNGLPCDAVNWEIEDDAHAAWLYMPCGLVRIARSELDGWTAHPTAMIQVTVFDNSDGVRTLAAGTHFSPSVAKSLDGKLWFTPWDGVSVVDPGHLYINKLPPPVHVEQIVADRRIHDLTLATDGRIRLPPLMRDLEIDYTALSLVAPEKVLFRYKLEGYDHDWQQAGTRRQAFYTNLLPGTYHFHVVACNNSGVWNEQGDTLEFSIAPAYYQTRWFLALCIAAVILFAWALYRLRLLQVARTLSARFDERLAERTRVARELHDTFLQTVQGSKLVADVALDCPTDPDHMRRALEQLSVWLGQAAQEARAALNSLRTSATEGNDLAEGLKRAAEECRLQRPIDISFCVTGAATQMHPVVPDEIYRIGYEAIRNACMHSQGSRLQLHLTYAQDLVLRVSDNGVGIDPTVSEKGREGHFGLQGMRERAARIGGKLTIAASANSGTEVTLTVPGRVAFLNAKTRLRGLKAIFARVMARFETRAQ